MLATAIHNRCNGSCEIQGEEAPSFQVGAKASSCVEVNKVTKATAAWTTYIYDGDPQQSKAYSQVHDRCASREDRGTDLSEKDKVKGKKES